MCTFMCWDSTWRFYLVTGGGGEESMSLYISHTSLITDWMGTWLSQGPASHRETCLSQGPGRNVTHRRELLH